MQCSLLANGVSTLNAWTMFGPPTSPWWHSYSLLHKENFFRVNKL